MYIPKTKIEIFPSKKEQKYLEKLINRTDNSTFHKLYEKFKNLNTHKELINFLNNQNIIKLDPKQLDNCRSINDMKEKIAYEFSEVILTYNDK